MTRVAAVDMGTNSTRLLIAEVDGYGRDARLVSIDRRMTITRLGAGVDSKRRLHVDAISRTLAALEIYGGAIRDANVEVVRAVATSAARDATNRDELFEPATKFLGVRPELIDGIEEAELSFLGATADLNGDGAPYLVVDIGGGSTEFVSGTLVPSGAISIDMGCVRLTEQFLHSDPPKAEELSAAVSFVRDSLAEVDSAVPEATSAVTLVGLAGTVSTIAAVELGLMEYDRDRIHGFRLTHDAAEDVFRTLATEPIAQRRHNPGLDPGRVDVIVGGAIVLVSLMRHFGFEEMLVSESDILDGIARTAAGTRPPK